MTDAPSKPRRVQLSRRKGWRMPPNTAKVDRTTLFGNPYPPRDDSPQARVASVAAFRVHAESLPGLREMAVRQLRGKNLACWCPLDKPCHADVLLEIANG